MGLRITSNIAALNAQRHLYNNTLAYHKSLEKLSSGLRINRAGDDAAGLAISESLKSDIRALEQAARNAGDGISLVQTAEGALEEINGMLLRMRELAEQSLNGTLSDSERGYLDLEYQALRAEIDRVAGTTEFNGVALLDGTLDVGIQVGIGTTSADRIDVSLTDAMDTAGLGLAASIATASDAADAMTQIEAATGAVVAARAEFGAVQSRLESSVRSIANTTENLHAANSRIRDVDLAAETARLTSYEILVQAGLAVLAQANLMPSLAISLLQ